MAKHGISTAKAFNACTSVVKDIIIPQKLFLILSTVFVKGIFVNKNSF